MTEYDYSPEAVERHYNKMRGISEWVRDTERATSPTSSTPRMSVPSYSKPRSMPIVAPIPIPMPAPQVFPAQPRPHTASSNDRHHSHHSHHHHRHSSRSRDDHYTSPTRSRTYSYAAQLPPPPQPVPTPYGSIPMATPQPRRGATIPGYGVASHAPNTQYVTYDPSRPLVINSNGVQYGYPTVPMPSQPRQPPLLKRLFTSLAWRPSARPQSAQLETRPPLAYGHQHSYSHSHSHSHSQSHSRTKSRDAGRERERDRDRRRRRRSSLP